MAEVLDKLSIEIYKLQEVFYFFYFGGDSPFHDYFDFIVFYFNFSSSN